MEPARMSTTTTPRARSRRTLTRLAVGAVTVVLAVLGVTAAGHPADGHPADGAGAPGTGAYVPPVKHVFVINLENKGYDATWGPRSAAPYLSRTLRSQGVLLNTYYGTAHNSQPNYVAQISGQGPNPQMQADCQNYTPFVGAGTVPPQQAVGDGCVFPASVATLPTQMEAKGLSWKGYMQDMGTPCRHPSLGAVDDTQRAKVGDEYAARHNPFVYFAAITGSPSCAQHDVDLSS